MSAEQNTTIKNALRSLGVSRGNFQFEEHYGRCVVYVDRKRFGIWDFARGTFVD
jgi:hypothetical protein